MTQVRMPDGTMVNFPDDMPKEQIREMITRKFPGIASLAQQAPRESLGRTVFDQGMQGATFGFADEAQDVIGSALAALATGGNYGDMLQEARQLTAERQQRQWDQRPGASTLANIAGGMATGVAGATTKAGAGIGNFLRSGNTGARVAKGLFAGAASGGLYGYGAGMDGERAESAVRGAILGGAGGGASPLLASGASKAVKGIGNIGRGIFARGAEELDEVAKTMRSAASGKFNKMREIGASFTPEANARILDDVVGSLKGDGILNQGLHGKTMSVLSDLQEAAKGGLDLEALHQWRQLFGQVASNRTPDGLQDARKASIVIDAIDDAIGALKQTDLATGSTEAIEALNDGMAGWAKLRKFEKVSDVIRKADGDPNKLKSGLKKMLDNKKQTRGFSDEEISALTRAARYTPAEGILKAFGKFGFDLGTAQTVGNTVVPIVSGVASGGVAPTIGTAARQGQKYMTRGKAESLLRVIESGGDVTPQHIRQLPPSEAQKFINALNPAQRSAILGSRSQTNQYQ